MEDWAVMEKPTELLFSVIQNMKIIFTEIFTLTFTENGVSALNFKRVCQISWIVCHRGSRGSRASVPPCLCGYFVNPYFFRKCI